MLNNVFLMMTYCIPLKLTMHVDFFYPLKHYIKTQKPWNIIRLLNDCNNLQTIKQIMLLNTLLEKILGTGFKNTNQSVMKMSMACKTLLN